MAACAGIGLAESHKLTARAEFLEDFRRFLTASQAEIQQLGNEILKTTEASEALGAYIIQKSIANNNALDTSESINNLIGLAKQCGASSEAIDILTKMQANQLQLEGLDPHDPNAPRIAANIESTNKYLKERLDLITDINNFDDLNEKNLLFTGNTGLGKTFLSSCIANEILKKQKTVLYQTAPIMLDSIIDYRFGKNSTNIYNNILDVDLLIIDDLGTECINNMKFTELFNIINTRLLNQNNKATKTIISTNLSIQNLFNSYDERIVSRLIGNYNICRFYGEDLRFKLRK